MACVLSFLPDLSGAFTACQKSSEARSLFVLAADGNDSPLLGDAQYRGGIRAGRRSRVHLSSVRLHHSRRSHRIHHGRAPVAADQLSPVGASFEAKDACRGGRQHRRLPADVSDHSPFYSFRSAEDQPEAGTMARSDGAVRVSSVSIVVRLRNRSAPGEAGWRLSTAWETART